MFGLWKNVDYIILRTKSVQFLAKRSRYILATFYPCVIQYQCDFEYYWPRSARSGQESGRTKKELKLYVTKNGHINHKFERVDGRS